MNSPLIPDFVETDPGLIGGFEGKIVCLLSLNGGFEPLSRKLNALVDGALARFSKSQVFKDMKSGEVQSLDFPAKIKAESIVVIKIGGKIESQTARDAGAAAARSAGKSDTLILAGASAQTSLIAQGFVLRSYNFGDHKTGVNTAQGALSIMVNNAVEAKSVFTPYQAVNEGVFFTRDLVNEPSNILTTTEFAKRLVELGKLGLKIKVLEEPEMQKLGMHALLGVGRGSRSPSKMAIMEWSGGGDEKPFALIGKGVVFDTGGISIKPAMGMEDMTMDMGGAGVVAGVMKAIALRKAKANVVGLVGIVENMPDGEAQRPGDVVSSMKGDTIEIINTDAEGRLVLADVLWFAQKTYAPSCMINLATLTGAIIIGLGHENAGVFSNDDKFCRNFLKAAQAEAEGAWRMPLAPAYHKLIKSRIADIKNTGGRAAGSITAAAFLEVFVEDNMPWIHLDIAGVASVKSETPLAPAGATGWGVRTLDRLIADNFEHGAR